MAIITPSVPELPKRMRSTLGTRATSSRARSISSGVDDENAVPRSSCSVTARITGAKACPWIRAVKLLMQSSRSTPSRSVTRAPRPEVRYRGCGRTLKFALEVPPGMRALASANNRAVAEPGAAKRLAPIGGSAQLDVEPAVRHHRRALDLADQHSPGGRLEDRCALDLQPQGPAVQDGNGDWIDHAGASLLGYGNEHPGSRGNRCPTLDSPVGDVKSGREARLTIGMRGAAVGLDT